MGSTFNIQSYSGWQFVLEYGKICWGSHLIFSTKSDEGNECSMKDCVNIMKLVERDVKTSALYTI